jgi:hypothetical protein
VASARNGSFIDVQLAQSIHRCCLVAKDIVCRALRVDPFDCVRPRVTGPEVAHEILLKTWSTLKRWLEDEREFLVWRGELDARREEYDKASAARPPAASGAPDGVAARYRQEVACGAPR